MVWHNGERSFSVVFSRSSIGKGESQGISLRSNTGIGGVEDLKRCYNALLQVKPKLETQDAAARRQRAWDSTSLLWERVAKEGGIVGLNGIVYALGSQVFGEKRQSEIDDAGIIEIAAAQLHSYGIRQEDLTKPNGLEEIYGESLRGITDNPYKANSSPRQKYFLVGKNLKDRIGYEVKFGPPRGDGGLLRKELTATPVLLGPNSTIQRHLGGGESSFSSAIAGIAERFYQVNGVEPKNNLIPPSTYISALFYDLYFSEGKVFSASLTRRPMGQL